MANLEYLGNALTRPLVLGAGKPLLSSGVDVIHNSIQNILTTARGTSFFLPEYGSRLHEVLFEPNDAASLSLLRYTIEESLNTWEKRIKFVDANFEVGEDFVSISITYRILQSNEIKSFVFPYYQEIIY